MSNNNIGKFTIPANVYTSWTLDDCSKFLGTNFIMYKQEYDYLSKKFEFVAFSPLFPSVDETKEIPTYTLSFDTVDETTTVTAKKHKVTLNTVLSNTQMNAIAQTAVETAVNANVAPTVTVTS